MFLLLGEFEEGCGLGKDGGDLRSGNAVVLDVDEAGGAEAGKGLGGDGFLFGRCAMKE
jgi:hypothetical protein